MARWLEGTSAVGWCWAKCPRLFAAPHRLVISMPEILRSLIGVLTSTWASTINRACRKLTPPINGLCDCATVRGSTPFEKSFNLQSFINGWRGWLLMVCFCIDAAPPHEGQTRCFCAPKHLGRVGHLLTLPNHRGSRRPRESHTLPQFSLESPRAWRPPFPSSSRPLPPSAHSCPPSSPSERRREQSSG